MELLRDWYLHLHWFGDAGKTEEEDSEEDLTDETTEEEEETTTEDDERLRELEVEGLSDEELRALVRKLSEKNKSLASLARDRLHEIMEKKQKLREIAEEKEKQRLKEMEEKEEYKKLYESLKPKYEVLEKDVGKTHQFFEEELGKAKEKLPKEYHKLVPPGDVRVQLQWIREFEQTVLPSLNNSTSTKKEVGTETAPKETKGTSAKTTIEDQIAKCSSAEELEALLSKYRGA